MFVCGRQRIESIDDRVRLGSRIGSVAVAAMRLDGRQQVVSPPVMQEERALAQSPQRGRAEFIARRQALDDVIRQSRTHVVQGDVREQPHVLVAQRRDGRVRRCGAVACGNACNRC